MKIIFEQDSGLVAVLAIKQGVTDLKDAAIKGVPKGKRFKLIEESQLPDETFFEAWRVDFTNHDGVGESQ